MAESTFEVDDRMQPGITPIQLESKSTIPPKIETLSVEAIEPERITILSNEPIKQFNAPIGKPLTEEDKARAVMNPFANQETVTEEPKPIHEDAKLADIPDAIEIPVSKNQPYAEQGVIVTDDQQEVKDEDAKKIFKEMMSGSMINKLIKKFDLQNINIEEEKAKIDEKKSFLSASQRKAVVALWNMRQLQKRTMEAIAKPMMPKESQKPEDVSKVIDQIEKDITDTNDAAKIVAHAIVEKAKENLEAKDSVKDQAIDAMQSALVTYDRTQFRGVFSSLDLIENPQKGDIANIIKNVDKEKGIQIEAAYCYDGNEWVFVNEQEVCISPEPNTVAE